MRNHVIHTNNLQPHYDLATNYRDTGVNVGLCGYCQKPYVPRGAQVKQPWRICHEGSRVSCRSDANEWFWVSRKFKSELLM